MSENEYEYESSSSSEDEKFGFWGGSGGSSRSLSKYMMKRAKEPKKDLKKDLATKREFEIAIEKAELARAELAKAEAARAELAKAEIVIQEIVAAESVNDIRKSRESQTLAQTMVGDTSQSNLKSHSSSAQQSKEQIHEATKNNIDHVSALMAAYVAQAKNQVPAFANRGVPLEVFDAEPELLDSIPASRVLRRIGAYRNWTEEEIQADLNALEFHRLRSVKDLRELSFDSWKEIKELLPLVRELLVKEINRGRQAPVTRPDIPSLPSVSSFSMSDTPAEWKNIRAPTSTPIDSPDISQHRRTFQGRQW